MIKINELTWRYSTHSNYFQDRYSQHVQTKKCSIVVLSTVIAHPEREREMEVFEQPHAFFLFLSCLIFLFS